MSKIIPGIIISLFIFLTACRKTAVIKDESLSPARTNLQQVLQPCAVREDPSRTALAARTRTPSSSPVVLLLDFDGEQVDNSAWNTVGTISCPAVPSSLLSNSMKDYILKSVAEDYSGFFVKVTRNESDYLAAPAAKRMRCVFTYNMLDQFGNVGGISFISSMSWGDNTPCFIFCDVLQYNQKYIAGAASHELGHTFGLQHQSRYTSDCSLAEEFNSGIGYDVLGWAPIMGLSYYQSLVTWHVGTSILGCDQVQNDMEIIKSLAGAKTDDYSASLNNNTAILPSNGSKTGILENAADVDAFSKNDNSSKRIKVTSNGNSDLAMEIYNTNGRLESVYDDTSGPNVNVVISGKKFIKIRVSSNQPFVPAGDGFGGYTIMVTTP